MRHRAGFSQPVPLDDLGASQLFEPFLDFQRQRSRAADSALERAQVVTA